ncbi:MAG: diguanylate cyclase [Actinomycetes bacterium]
MSLRVRLTLVLVTTVLLPLLAVAVVVTVLVPRVAADEVADRLEVTARSAATALTRQCTSLGLAARSLAVEAAPRLVTGEPVPASAAEGAAAGLPATTTAVLGPSGDVLVSAGDLDLTGTQDRSCSQDARADAVQVESVPIRTADGAVAGWAVAAADLGSGGVDALRDAAGLPAGLLLVGDGEVLAAAVAGVGTTSAGLAEVAASVDVSGERLTTGRTGDLRWAALGRVPGVPGAVVAVEPVRTSFLSWTVPLLLALAASLAVAGTLLLARRLTAPLEELTRTVVRLGHGDLSTRSVVGGHDEVGRLAAAVNTMADRLEQSLADAAAGHAALSDSLERFGEALARTHDLGGLLQTVAQTAAGEAGADTCVVYVVDSPEGRGLVERAVVDLEVHSPPTRRTLREVARRTVTERREVTLLSETGVNVVGLPLVHGDRVLGAMVLAGRRHLDDEQLAPARSLARPAGTAVSNVLVHEETARLSMTDALTGLANFRSLSDTLAHEVERAVRFDRPLAVLMLDIDHFKGVNDSWGHAVGDRTLSELAARLRSLVREVDTVARYGGEEFVIVLPETSSEGAQEVAQRVVEAVRREPFGSVADGEPLRVTVSVGVAAYPEHAESAAELMRRADQALYAAKAAGRDRWAAADGRGAGATVAG